MALSFYRTQYNINVGHCQLTRSVERILEESQISGELRLPNRKLKEFPRAAKKYNLSDTVIADLSRNRFCELPDEVTAYAFLETLLLYHNTIRTISHSIKSLTSLTYLDLRSNQLFSLPREICFLPLQVLLVAHNRLTSLPDELGRMDRLTELDASCNQIVNLPTKIGDLKSLRSLSLRSNQLVYLPREITFLSLISLDISNNRISSLPIDIRQMTTLVNLKLDNNPLTSPPASLCMRGLVHILKFLEIQSIKEDKGKFGNNADGLATLRRTPRNSPSIIDDAKTRRHHIDSGYCTSDGLDKRWSQDTTNATLKNGLYSPKLLRNAVEDEHKSFARTCNRPEIDITNGPKEEEKFPEFFEQEIDYNNLLELGNSNMSENISQDGLDGDVNIDKEKGGNSKHLSNVQTYREYKEALKQQRNQEVSNVYRTIAQRKVSNDLTTNDNQNDEQIVKDCTIRDICPNQHNHKVDGVSVSSKRSCNCFEENTTVQVKKPIQKVIPSRNMKQNKIEDAQQNEPDYECYEYVKPSSPIKSNGVSSPNLNQSFTTTSTTTSTTSNKKESSARGAKLRITRNVSWNQDTSEILSFTMRREFDKQKEETELIARLRHIIETRLKMSLPEDIAPSLTDGVILCHLANCARPRSIASIHVPSPGVPKLTMARCRRNVDNFLEACRKIGVDEELICSWADVVNGLVIGGDNSLPSQNAVYKTVSALIRIINEQQEQQQKQQQQEQQPQQHQQRSQFTTATNSNEIGQLDPTEFLFNGNQESLENGNNPPISIVDNGQNLICCAADVLEGKAVVQIAITVGEIFRLQEAAQMNNTKSPTRLTKCNGNSFSLAPTTA